MTLTNTQRIAALEKLHPAGTPAGHHVHPTTPPPTPPPPTTRPWPAPVTSRSVTAPATGDLSAFVKAQPDGTVIEIPAAGVYGTLLIEGRNNLVIHGNGATLKQTGPGNAQNSSAICIRASTHIAVDGFAVVGNNPDTTNIFVPGSENSHAFCIGGWYGGGPSSYIELAGVTASHVYGDFAYLEGRNSTPYEPSHHIWIHDNAATWIGRNAVSYIDNTDTLVEGNTFDKIGMDALDIEPNFAGQVIARNVFRLNEIGAYGYMTQFQGWFVNTWSPQLSPVSDITVDDNDVAGNPAGRYSGSPRALHANIDHSKLSGIVFTNNRTALAAAGPVLICGSGYHATQSGNVQPLLSGSFTNCTP